MSHKLFLQIAALILLAGVVAWAVLRSLTPDAPEPLPIASNPSSLPLVIDPANMTAEERAHGQEIMNRVLANSN